MEEKKELWMVQTKRADFSGLAMRLGVSPGRGAGHEKPRTDGRSGDEKISLWDAGRSL